MITAYKDGVFVVILEPGNVDLIEVGRPIVVKVPSDANGFTEIFIAYTPDIQWVVNRMKTTKESILTVLQKSLSRPEIHIRGYHSPETFTRDDN